MNPYLVKELRQLTRSKTVSGGLVLLLFGQLAVAALVAPAVLRNGDPDAVDALGAILLGVFGGILGLALCVVLPVAVFGRFVAENPKGRASVELATAAPPAAAVDGKLRAGFVLAAALVAGSLPFQLLCVALRGVDFVAVLFHCASMLLACSVQLHFAVLFAAPREQSAGARWTVMVLFQVFFGLYMIVATVGAAVASAGGSGLVGDPPSAGVALGILAAAASLNLLLRASAVRALSPPSTDRDRAPRLTLLALWAAWGTAAAVAAFVDGDGEPLATWAGFFAAATAVSFFTAAGSPKGVSRRVLAERPASRVRRWLRLPFSAGFAGGFVFAAALLSATLPLAFGLALAADPAGPSPADDAAWLRWIATMLYVLSVPTVLRGIFTRKAPDRHRPFGVTWFSYLALFLLQLVPVLLFAGFAGPPLGFPFFLHGVFACDAETVPLHLVFGGLAFLGGIVAVSSELRSSLRAYLAPPKP